MAIDGNSLDDGEELAHRSGAPIGSVGLVLGRAFLDSPGGATERLRTGDLLSVSDVGRTESNSCAPPFVDSAS